MILAKFGQKLLAVENSAGIALGCIEADFLRFESSGIARRCAQPLPQHHFAISSFCDELNFPPNFERLVLGCIDAGFCK